MPQETTSNLTAPDDAPRQSADADLLIHVGSPKTGSTALQNFLMKNQDSLYAKGLHFVKEGRSNISHNNLFAPLRGADAADIWSAVAEEVAAEPGRHCVMSSENFFSPEIATSIREHMPQGLRRRTRVLVYLRRQDDFLEAMYKQKTKNGRERASPRDFARKRGTDLADYLTVLESFARSVGIEKVTVRRFQRGAFRGGDIVADFLGEFGLDKSDPEFAQPRHDANQTLSRAVTEQLGAFARNSSINVRELAREMSRLPDGAPRRSGDVFTKMERIEIMAHFAECNAMIAERYLRGGQNTLFDTSDLSQDAPDRYPDAEEELRLYADAQEKIASAMGRIESRGRAKLFRGDIKRSAHNE